LEQVKSTLEQLVDESELYQEKQAFKIFGICV
jgi:hypothetical protein